MKIHPSHSKKDLVDYIEKNNINIIDPDKLNKKQLINQLDKLENIEYLIQPNQLKNLSVKDKNNIMKLSKQIISLYKNGFLFNQSFFKDKEEVIKVAEKISIYGDIPSVRRAVKMVNDQFRTKIKCKISENVQEVLDHKQKIKDLAKPKFDVKYGKFKVEF
jgi:hypothetical protein